jgi:hypothetical protein
LRQFVHEASETQAVSVSKRPDPNPVTVVDRTSTECRPPTRRVGRNRPKEELVSKLLIASLIAAVSLVPAAPAAADAPTKQTTHAEFALVDDETCAFPFDVTVDRTRTVTTFANGDVKRHTELIVTFSTSGATIVDRASFNVFVSADSTDVWVITGTFFHPQLKGEGTLYVQSGRLLYDVAADQVIDAHHHGSYPNVCAALSA